MNPEVTLLETFVAAAEELHFATAAERVNLDPSTVSRHVRQLETRYDIVLFSRTTRRVTLTAAGEALLPVARRALEAMAALDVTTRVLKRAERGEIVVGMSAHAAGAATMAVLAEGAAALGVRVSSTEVGFDDTSAGVRGGACDLGIVHEPIDETDLVIRPLMELPRIAILPATHRLAGASTVRLRDLLDDPWIAPSCDDRVFYDYWMAIDQREGRPPSIGAVVHTADAGLIAVMAGQGISVGATARAGFHMDDLVTIPIEDLAPCRIGVAVRTTAPSRVADSLASRLHDRLWTSMTRETPAQGHNLARNVTG